MKYKQIEIERTVTPIVKGLDFIKNVTLYYDYNIRVRIVSDI